MLWSSVLILGLAQLSTSKILRRWNDVAEKHSWVEVPNGWEYKAPAAADHLFELRIGMKQSGMDELIANLMEISDPSHSRHVSCLLLQTVY